MSQLGSRSWYVAVVFTFFFADFGLAQKLPVEELKQTLERRRSSSTAAALEFPGLNQGRNQRLKKGLTAETLQVATRMVAARGIETTGQAAVEILMDEIRTRAVQTGDLEAATDQASPEAIIIARAELRPALRTCRNVIDDPVPETWYAALSARQTFLKRAMTSVGLVSIADVPNSGPKGTCFVAATDIVITNRHVAETFAVSDGNGGFTFRRHPATGTPARVTIDFTRDRCSLTSNARPVTQIIHVEPEPGPDVAVLRVSGEVPAALKLQTDPIATGLPGTQVVVVGFPFADRRNPIGPQTEIFGHQFGIKRLAPGRLMLGSGEVDDGGQEPLLWHDCSTLGGNSGSAVFDLDSKQIIGVHFAGNFAEQNLAWPMWRVARIPAVRSALGL